MKNIIQKLVEVDKLATLKVTASKDEYESLNISTIDEQNRLNELKINEKKALVDKTKKQLNQDNEKEMEKIELEFNQSIQLLEATFNANKKQYVNEIVSRITKQGE